MKRKNEMKPLVPVVHLEMSLEEHFEYLNLKTDEERSQYSKKQLDKMFSNNPLLKEKFLAEAKQKELLNKKLREISAQHEKAKFDYLRAIESIIQEMLPQEVNLSEFMEYGKYWEGVSPINLDQDDLVDIALDEARFAEIVIENFDEILEMFEENNL